MQIKEKVLFAGFGGQGILAAGKVFADCCVGNGLNASWLPSYGPEMRGGTCNCQVVVSDGEILSPIFTRPSYLVILNQASFDRFSQRLQSAKYVIVNSTLVTIPEELRRAHPDVAFVEVPATELAQGLGSARSANIVMLGAMGQWLKGLDYEDLKASIAQMFEGKAAVQEVNLKALEQGYAHAAH